MSCSVAVVSNSPVFSPSSSLFSSFNNPHAAEALTHLKGSPSSSPSSPCSPFRFRLQKPPSGLNLSTCFPPVGSDGSTTVLKRKRPARLDIPLTTSLVFPGPLTRGSGEVEEEGTEYSVYCKRGRKKETMEDRFSVSLNILGDPKQAFFGVFDGHGGAKAAEFAAKNLDKNILEEIGRRGGEDMVLALKDGYLNTDDQFSKEDSRGGSCCVTALIRDGSLVVSNAGDCRAVMSVNGVAEALTSDHRPCREDEKDRIETLGGYVDLVRGVWRVQGSLAVSRGIGDRHLKQWVIAEPETKFCKIKPDHEFLILASDGLWDKVANQEAVDIARPFFVGAEQPEQLVACKKLVNLAVSRGSCDDISVMLIQLEQFF